MSTPETETHQHPALGEPGEQCAHCGAVLAPDQRYCVNCGLRRADPRVEYRELLSTGGAVEDPPATPPAATAAAPAPAPPQADAAPATRTVSPLGAAVAIGLLLLATLLGAVLGRGSDAGDQRPVIVGAPATAAGATTAGAPDATTGGVAAGAAAGAAAGGAAGAAAGAESDSTSKSGSSDSGASSAAPKTSTPAPSTQDFVKKSKKLPDKVGTGGAPPPKDDAAPGGGSEGTTIG